MTTTNDIAKRVTKDIVGSGLAGKFIERIVADALPLIVKDEWDSEDGPDFAAEAVDRIRSHYEPTPADVEVVMGEYMISYDEVDDQLKRDEDDPLDVWLNIPEENNEDGEAEYEANTFRRHNGDYVIEWYHNAVGLVTTETFGTYEEAVSWYEENGYQDFTA